MTERKQSYLFGSTPADYMAGAGLFRGEGFAFRVAALFRLANTPASGDASNAPAPPFSTLASPIIGQQTEVGGGSGTGWFISATTTVGISNWSLVFGFADGAGVLSSVIVDSFNSQVNNKNITHLVDMFFGLTLPGSKEKQQLMYIDGDPAAPNADVLSFTPAPIGNDFKVGQGVAAFGGAPIDIADAGMGCSGFGFADSLPEGATALAVLTQTDTLARNLWNTCVETEDFPDDPNFTDTYSTRRGFPVVGSTWNAGLGGTSLRRVGTEGLAVEAARTRYDGNEWSQG